MREGERETPSNYYNTLKREREREGEKERGRGRGREVGREGEREATLRQRLRLAKLNSRVFAHMSASILTDAKLNQSICSYETL